MLKDLIKRLSVKIGGIFALFGFTISLIIVLIKGSGFPELILRPLASGFIMAIFWAVCYFLLEKLAPDFLGEIKTTFSIAEDLPSQAKGSTSPDDDPNFNFELDPTEPNSGDETQHPDELKSEKVSEDIKINMSEPERKINAAKPKTKAGGDEIMVQGIPIKKDPELMARAIQHVLDKDTD